MKGLAIKTASSEITEREQAMQETFTQALADIEAYWKDKYYHASDKLNIALSELASVLAEDEYEDALDRIYGDQH